MTSPQAKIGVEVERLPELPTNLEAVLRRIRRCESEVPAQLVLEHAMRAYATAALAAARAEAVRMREENEKLRTAILEGARRAEALKRDCGMDPESPIALQNSRYMGVSYFLRAALSPSQGETNV